MENAKTPSKKKLLLGVLALVLVIGALIGVYFAFSPKPTQGAKTVTVEVIPLEGEEIGRASCRDRVSHHV